MNLLKKTVKRACGEINALAGNEKTRCARLSVWRPLSLLRAVQVPYAQPLDLQQSEGELDPGIGSGCLCLPGTGCALV